MKNILVTGANGQLGREIHKISNQLPDWNWIFADSSTLNITNHFEINHLFTQYEFEICINTAAYTAVDQAESDSEKAEKVNAKGVEVLAKICKQYHTLFFHISTDFVFDGSKTMPYTEKDSVNPLNVYGKTKHAGEVMAQLNPKTFVLRTSWLYSSFGHNFVKTMLRLGQDKSRLNIVYDQIGTPTYARDLATCILTIIQKTIPHPDFKDYGIYHFSNEGVASWYDFAEAIFEYSNINIEVQPIPSVAYPTPATRPHFSVMDKGKIKTAFDLKIPHWRTSLKKMLSEKQT